MDKMHKNFEGNLEKEQKLIVPEFVDLTLLDFQKEGLPRQISEADDLSYIPKDILETTDFDTTFKWPEKLPEGFNPEKVMEEGENPGLGIRKLHEEGITGKGITVAIIDQKLSSKHEEFKDSLISNKEYVNGKPGVIKEDISMHGPAVASILVGEKCGIAPDAKLYYAGHNTDINSFFSNTKALKDIFEYNKTHEDKIKIVSVSKGYQEIPGVNEWLEIKKEAKKSGITVIDSDYFGENNITGGGSKTDKDKFDDYELPLFYKESERQELTVEDVKNKLSSVSEDRRKEFFDKYKSIEDFIENRKKELSSDLIVPSDYRTMASRKGDGEYVYNAKGGWSWAIPYYAGVFALALQVKPDLTNERFLEIVHNTAGKTKKGLKVINPKGIIEEVKKIASENKQ
jgi:hypothetical protein